MESTAKILASIESAAFERICGPVLQKMVPELKNLIPSGINDDGRTIKSLSDGFCFVSRTHYATIHITTNVSNLKRKWLYDGNSKTTPKGDLIKSIIQAREIYQKHPDYKFSIYLVYNNRVDESLHLEVNEANTDEFISVKIIEQRDLVCFLDYEPEGQYIRKEFLGIDAIRISEPLLKDIAKINFERYGQEIYLETEYLASLSNQKKVEKELGASGTCINLLTSRSGFGKSTLCFLIGNSILVNGGIALRLKPQIVDKANSLNDSIKQQLKNEYPNLFINEGDIHILFQNSTVIIDDINKLDNAVGLLDKIISWNKEKESSSINVLCPVWPSNLDALDNKLKKRNRYTVISLDPPSFYDCKAIVQQRIGKGLPLITDQQIHSLIVDSGFDPLLLNFSIQLLSEMRLYTQNISIEAIKCYVSDKVLQINHLYGHPVYLINKVLESFGKRILKHQKLHPHLNDIQNWFGQKSEEYQLINSIANQRQLFSFDQDGICHFRHDRVREYILILAAVDLFNDLASNKDILTDPYFSEITGAAVSKVPLQNESLTMLIESNPLTLFCSLKFLQDTSSESYFNNIVDAISKWTKAYIATTPKAITNAITQVLMGFDTKQIEKITEGLPNSAKLELVKFRNGVWQSGINFFSFIDYFYPEAPTYWWDSVLAHVKSKYLDQIFIELCDFLVNENDISHLANAYTLIGFFRDSRFMQALKNSWDKYSNPANYVAYIWAVLNSFTKEDSAILKEALFYWGSIPVDIRAKRIRNTFSSRIIEDQLKYIDWEFSEEQIMLLVELSSNQPFREICAMLFSNIDNPGAFSVVLDYEMQREEKKPWDDDWDDRWNFLKTQHNLSQPSIDYLFQQFYNKSHSRMRRYLAWRYWAGNVDRIYGLETARTIISEDDSLFEEVLLWRIENKDNNALYLVKKHVTIKPWLIRTLYDIWNEETLVFFENWLSQKLNSKNDLEYGLELLKFLDNSDANYLLIKYWKHLKWHPHSIATALFLSTLESKKLADDEIRRLGFIPNEPMPTHYYRNISGYYFSDSDELSIEQKENLLLLAEHFKYLYLRYTIKYKGDKERLTPRKLESLLPYLPLFDEHSIYEFAIRSLDIGAVDLCYQKFYPLLSGHLRRRIRYNKEDVEWELRNKYKELVNEKKVFISHFIENADKLGVTNDMLTSAIKSFCEDYNDVDAFFLIAILLENLGTRKDIYLLNFFKLDSEKERATAEYWKRNTIFSIKARTLS